MYFENFAALIAMEGHGPYVWSAYAIALVVLLGLVLTPLRKRRQLMTQLRMQLRREQSAKPSRGESNASGS
jgi:heme exporter protein D